MRFRLVPTDDRFFALFSESARNAEECARRLRDVLGDPTGPDGFKRVIECERRGDELTAQILQRLDTSFVTPFDREDIHALAEELDDVVDDMNSVAALMQVVHLTEPLPELTEQADVLVKVASATVELIDRLESEGDEVYRRTLARLFSGEFEALDVLKWKDIVTAMEAAINTLEDISDVVESIIFKHA